MPFSDKQLDYILNSNHSFNIASGVVSSGKTFAQVIRWHEYIVNKVPNNSLLMMSGKTKESLYDNIVRDWVALENPSPIKVQKQPLRIQIPSKNIEIACVGADDESSWSRVQGKTVAGWLADEIVSHPESLTNMAITRCRAGGKTRPKFWTCNPDHPSHYVKKRFIDNKKLDVKNWAFGFNDNPILSKEYIQELENAYEGIFYERFILGKWVIAEGAIYNKFNRQTHVINYMPEVKEYVLGIDWGYENPLTIGLIGIDYDNTYYVLDEIYVTKQDVDVTLINMMQNKGWYELPCDGRKVKPSYAYADSNRPDYVNLFGRLSGIPCIGADKRADSVAQGIQAVQRKFKLNDKGRAGLYFHEGCVHHIEEHENYRWKHRKITGQEIGTDEPEKMNDHTCDEVRYVIFTRERQTMRTIKTNPFRGKPNAKNSPFR